MALLDASNTCISSYRVIKLHLQQRMLGGQCDGLMRLLAQRDVMMMICNIKRASADEYDYFRFFFSSCNESTTSQNENRPRIIASAVPEYSYHLTGDEAAKI